MKLSQKSIFVKAVTCVTAFLFAFSNVFPPKADPPPAGVRNDTLRAMAAAQRAASPLNGNVSVARAVQRIVADRPVPQILSIAAQLRHIREFSQHSDFINNEGIVLAIAGGRIRVIFMHPDAPGFFGPALQAVTGGNGKDDWGQIVMNFQPVSDNRIDVRTADPAFQTAPTWVRSDLDYMYPGDDIQELTETSYEAFGTRIILNMLKSFGFYTKEEAKAEEERTGIVIPKEKLIEENLKRGICILVAAIGAFRCIKTGPHAERIQRALGRGNFHGLLVSINGNVPIGGFSTDSAITVNIVKALNDYYDLGFTNAELIEIARITQYAEGLKAGALDQTTIMVGKPGQSILFSSNPDDHFAPIGDPITLDRRYLILYPYSVDRDTQAVVDFSGRVYSSTPAPASGGRLSTGQIRKMTGNSARIAAVLLQELRAQYGVEPRQSFFQEIQQDLLDDGMLTPRNLLRVYRYLRALPQAENYHLLRDRVGNPALFDGWVNPVWITYTRDRFAGYSVEVEHSGVPVRAMLAYLYGEVAKNLFALRHQSRWLELVSRSQLGDRCFNIILPSTMTRADLESELDWEKGVAGPEILDLWLKEVHATRFDFDQGLYNHELDEKIKAIEAAIIDDKPVPEALQLHMMEGSSFFRGLALIDLAEAMLKRAFGDAVAVRVNAAGQGGSFQVHIDQTKVKPEEVEAFIRKAIYERFGLTPRFDVLYPGGPAVSVKLNNVDRISELADALDSYAGSAAAPQRVENPGPSLVNI